MAIETAMILSGALFWLIIITNFASERFGYITFNELEPEAKLQKINDNPKKFKIGVMLILIEHASIIALAVVLFIAFSPYNKALAFIWIILRTAEGLIQICYKKKYWRLLELALKCSGVSGTDKYALIESARSILKTKGLVFSLTQILFSIGTLAYSLLFISYGVTLTIIGWFGIAASIIYGLGNLATLIRRKFKAVWYIGGLLVLLYEIVLGGWLLFIHNIP